MVQNRRLYMLLASASGRRADFGRSQCLLGGYTYPDLLLAAVAVAATGEVPCYSCIGVYATLAYRGRDTG